MISVLHNRTYTRLFGAQVVALLGTGVATVALGLLAYELAGERASLVLGAVLAVKMVAYVLVAPMAAAAVANLPRRRVLVASNVLRLVVALALPFVDQLWQVFVLIFVLQAASATFTPTFQSVIPAVLVDEEDYTRALSLSRLAYDLEAIVSPLVAAALLLVLSAQNLFFGTAFGFAASTLLVLAAALPLGLGLDHDMDAPESALGARARAGWTLFFRNPALRPILALNMAVAASGAFVLVHTVLIVRSSLVMSEPWVALFLGINGAGSMLTALLLPRLLERMPERRVMVSGAVLLALAAAGAAFALWSSRGVALAVAVGVVWFLVGVGWSAVETPVGRIIRRSVPSRQLNQAFAAQFSLSHACWLSTYPLTGVLERFGLPLAASVSALVAAAAAALAVMLWPRAADRVGSAPVETPA